MIFPTSPASSFALATCSIVGAVAASLPQVDLGYAIYQGRFHEDNQQLFNFSNIRYGQAPVGDLRFAKPVAPSGRDETVDTGDIGRICPQAMAAWEVQSFEAVPHFLAGEVLNLTAKQKDQIKYPSDLALPIDPRETEDCLFLDVVTPSTTFQKSGQLAPVMVWFYGGGYTTGDKAANSPTGLIDASYASSPEGIVYVSINSRVGVFGWIAGSKLSESMVANAALYDQRLALKWIQDNIHHFGGDPKRVTIMGQSSGGGGIMHHLMAFGGKDSEVLFQRAIPQSASWVAVADTGLEDSVVNKFLTLANVSSLEDARKLSYADATEANRLLISNSDPGTSTTGPFVDGVIAPKLPDLLLMDGEVVPNVDVLVGYNGNEGLVFTSPLVVDDDSYRTFLRQNYANASPETIDLLANDLYPSVFDGSVGYHNQTQRAEMTKSDSEFLCRYEAFQKGFGDKARSYYFNVYPSVHGEDVEYTFYDKSKPAAGVNETLAVAFQQLLTSFAATGVAKSPSVPGGIPAYGGDKNVLEIAADGFHVISNPAVQKRCDFWLSGAYL